MKIACNLRNFEAYNKFNLANFDTEKMEISHFSKLGVSNIKSSGFFYKNGCEVSGFFFAENCWYFFIGGEVSKISEISSLNRHYSGDSGACIDILLKDERVLKIKYSCENKIEGDMTPFVEDEDFDFGLFFENVLSNEDRLRRMADCQ